MNRVEVQCYTQQIDVWGANGALLGELEEGKQEFFGQEDHDRKKNEGYATRIGYSKQVPACHGDQPLHLHHPKWLHRGSVSDSLERR